MRARRVVILVVGVGLAMILGATGAWGQCVPGAEPPLPAVSLPAEDQQFLDDFGAALRRFRGMSLDEFFAEYASDRDFLDERAAFLRGDANGDGRHDLGDTIYILSYLFVDEGPWKTPPCESALDVNDTGEIAIDDPIYLLNYLFASGPAPKAPFPEFGSDPTPDTLRCESTAPLLDYDPLDAEYVDLISGPYPLSDDQTTVLRQNGFVVKKDIQYDSFLGGYASILSADLPVYITVDSILDTLHYSFDKMLMDIEEEFIVPDLDAMLRKMEAGIEDLRTHAGGMDIERDLDDVAFWVCTARSLLAGQKVPCARGTDPRTERFLAAVARQTMEDTDFFGWIQCEDFSQFQVRGHYTKTETLQKYFRAMMWVQRIGMKFAQLRRHAAVAYLLAQDLQGTGAIAEWERINGLVETFVGVSDSLTPPQMLDLASKTGVDSVADLYDDQGFTEFVRTALETGAGRQRILSQVLWSNPTYIDKFTPIPPAFHVMGQRFIVDSFIFTNVVFDRVPPTREGLLRELPSPLDAMFVLGHHSAASLLKEELETFQYQGHLAALDWIVSRYPEEFWRESLYNLWLSGIRELNADTTRAPYPKVMQTRVWGQRMLNAQLASWTQLRHDTVLYAKPSYTGGACDYPDGWVDAYPAFFRALSRYADGAKVKLGVLGLLDTTVGRKVEAYLGELRSSSEALAEIADAEIAGAPLTVEQVTFIKALVWVFYGVKGGWFPKLLYGFDFETAAANMMASSPDLDAMALVTDVHTSPNTREVLHVAVGRANPMIITVKNGCATRAYVGPVYSYYEFKEPNLKRLTDEEWIQRVQAEEPPRPTWVQSFIR